MWALGPYWHRCERLASGGPMWALGPQGTHSCKRPSSFRVLKRWAFGTWEKHCSRHEIWCWRCSLFWGPFAHIFVWQTQTTLFWSYFVVQKMKNNNVPWLRLFFIHAIWQILLYQIQAEIILSFLYTNIIYREGGSLNFAIRFWNCLKALQNCKVSL